MTQQVFDMEKFQEQGYLVARDVLDPDERPCPRIHRVRRAPRPSLPHVARKGHDLRHIQGSAVQRTARPDSHCHPRQLLPIRRHFLHPDRRRRAHAGPLGPRSIQLTQKSPACWTPSSSSSAQRYIATQFSMSVSSHPRLPYRKTCLATRPSGTRPGTRTRGVIISDADESDILTVWLPVIEATEENGCMVVVPGSHRAGLVPHCPPKPEREARAHLGGASRRGRYTRASEARRRSVHAQADHALLPAQPQQRHTLELRPPVQPHRPGHGSAPGSPVSSPAARPTPSPFSPTQTSGQLSGNVPARSWPRARPPPITAGEPATPSAPSPFTNRKMSGPFKSRADRRSRSC